VKKPATKSKLKSRVLGLLKFSLVAGLLYFLAKKGFISVDATQQALQQWRLILPAVIVLFATVPLGVVRWKWLLASQEIHLNWLKALQLTFIGLFFNIALPGAVSGDFVKAYYVGKALKADKTKALGSILFDRVAGVSALALVSAGALILGFQSFLNSSLFTAVRFVMGTAAASVLGFYAYLFLVRERHDPLLRGFRFLEKKLKPLKSITEIYLSLRHYHHHRWCVFKVLVISIVIHLAVGWSCLCFAQALGESHLSLLSLYVIVPLGLLVTAIPVAPGGVGTGNVAFLYLFQLIHSERGADVFSLFALSQILFGCLGGLVYLSFKTHEPLPEMRTG
jgi:glycosyltransferase 2 family protein